jgi:hypothetical protein
MNNTRGSLRGRSGLRPPFPLPSAAAVSSDEDLSSSSFGGSPLGRSSGRRQPPPPGRSIVKPVDTQVIDRNASTRKQPAANL